MLVALQPLYFAKSRSSVKMPLLPETTVEYVRTSMVGNWGYGERG